MEIFLLGVVVGVVGAKGKRILKPLARGYLEAAERAREFGAELRENFEDALAERHDLAAVVAVLEAAAAAALGAPEKDTARQLAQLQREARTPEPPPLLTVSQRHLVPGRLRVRVAGLRRCREAAPYLLSGLR